jgi:hypothetical protein
MTEVSRSHDTAAQNLVRAVIRHVRKRPSTDESLWAIWVRLGETTVEAFVVLIFLITLDQAAWGATRLLSRLTGETSQYLVRIASIAFCYRHMGLDAFLRLEISSPLAGGGTMRSL